MYSFVKRLFQDMPTNFTEIGSYLTRHRAKKIVATLFLRHGVLSTKPVVTFPAMAHPNRKYKIVIM